MKNLFVKKYSDSEFQGDNIFSMEFQTWKSFRKIAPKFIVSFAKLYLVFKIFFFRSESVFDLEFF